MSNKFYFNNIRNALPKLMLTTLILSVVFAIIFVPIVIFTDPSIEVLRISSTIIFIMLATILNLSYKYRGLPILDEKDEVSIREFRKINNIKVINDIPYLLFLYFILVSLLIFVLYGVDIIFDKVPFDITVSTTIYIYVKFILVGVLLNYSINIPTPKEVVVKKRSVLSYIIFYFEYTSIFITGGISMFQSGIHVLISLFSLFLYYLIIKRKV